jgi:RNA polymerase sigma-70 factor (ECF subfamily)
MKYQDEMSIREIGEILDKSESAIKMKIKRAKHRFRQTYDDKYKDN